MSKLIEHSGMNQVAIAKLAKIPLTTLNGIVKGTSTNPRLYTLASIARVFNIHISQLVGEYPLNFTENAVPVLKWSDLNVNPYQIKYHISSDTKFTSSSITSNNRVFALKVSPSISDIYNDNSIIIVEEISLYQNHDLIILSIDHSDPMIKKIFKEGHQTFLSSISADIPIQELIKDKSYIYGVIKETRFIN